MRVADVQRLAVQGTVQSVGKDPVQHWADVVALVVSGGLGMPDVHGRPASKDVQAATNCDHAHLRVVTARDVHISRSMLADVLEQMLHAVLRTPSIARLLQTVTTNSGSAS